MKDNLNWGIALMGSLTFEEIDKQYDLANLLYNGLEEYCDIHGMTPVYYYLHVVACWIEGSLGVGGMSSIKTKGGEVIGDRRSKAGVMWNAGKRLIEVIEYDRVRGKVIRQYRPAAFFKKFHRLYTVDECSDVKLEDILNTFEILFPKLDAYSIKEFPQPSKMYDYREVWSCMVGTDFVGFYDTAPVTGVGVMMGDRLVARALVWTTDDGRKVLGRVYDNTFYAKQKLMEYAQAHDILPSVTEDMTVTCKWSEFGLPYQDDFTYGLRSVDGKIIKMFASRIQAGKEYQEDTHLWMRTGPDCPISTTSQCGGHTVFYEKVVKVKGGYSLKSDIVRFEGEYYNLRHFDFPSIDTLHTAKATAIFRNPSNPYQLCYASDLVVHDGYIYPKGSE